MTWRFIEPPKPMLVGDDFLEDIDGDWIAESKLDGWRCEISKEDGNISCISRRGQPQKVSDELLRHFKLMPNGMSVDCEWLNPIRMKAINKEHGTKLPMVECLSVFDVRWFGGKFMGAVPLKERRNIPFFASLPIKDIADCVKHMTVFQAPHCTGDEAHQFFERQKAFSYSEGIVLKYLEGTINGSKWYKVKYRA